nr:MAG TPA: hypothetical protein [Caudoviricetes sp.]
MNEINRLHLLDEVLIFLIKKEKAQNQTKTTL